MRSSNWNNATGGYMLLYAYQYDYTSVYSHSQLWKYNRMWRIKLVLISCRWDPWGCEELHGASVTPTSCPQLMYSVYFILGIPYDEMKTLHQHWILFWGIRKFTQSQAHCKMGISVLVGVYIGKFKRWSSRVDLIIATIIMFTGSFFQSHHKN
jgi:hypothetical protein